MFIKAILNQGLLNYPLFSNFLYILLQLFRFCTTSNILVCGGFTYLTFYQMNCHFLVTSILFVDFTYLILVFTFKSACVFHIFTWMIRVGLFPPHSLDLPTSLRSGNYDLTDAFIIFQFYYFIVLHLILYYLLN